MPFLILVFSGSIKCGGLCDISSCDCVQEGEILNVICDGEMSGDLELSPSSIPEATSTLNVSNFAHVLVQTNAFFGGISLYSINVQQIQRLTFKDYVFSEEEEAAYLDKFTIENVGQLMLTGAAFDNAPQMNVVTIKNVTIKNVPSGGIKLHADTMTVQDCQIGELNGEGIYSDSMNFIFIGNTVGVVRTHGFSGSNNVFNFSFNFIDNMESNAMSVAFLNGDFTRFKLFLNWSWTKLFCLETLLSPTMEPR